MPKVLSPPTFVALFLALALIFTPKSSERYGSTLQVALPLAGWACGIASGNGLGMLGRFAGMWITVKASKKMLGDAEINVRPNGLLRGFPSGHTAAATFGASALVHTCLKNAPILKTVVIVGAAFTGGSRIEAQHHTLGQVLAGALWALLFERGARRTVWVRIKRRRMLRQRTYRKVRRRA